MQVNTLVNQAASSLTLYRHLVSTPLGEMIALSDEEALYLLEFTDRIRIERQVRQLCAPIVQRYTTIHVSIEEELAHYFEGKLTTFKTPLRFVGTQFQKAVWEALACIPYGQSRSYLELATSIGNPKAFRAVAQANGANRMALVIPCHRVVNANGALGGYAGGLDRKSWLLTHEKRVCG